MKYVQKFVRKFDDRLLRLCNATCKQSTIKKETKGYILSFPKKGDLGITKKYRSITLTSMAVSVYNALLLNRIKPGIEKILWKNQNDFQRNQSTTSLRLTTRRIIDEIRAKCLEATLLLEDFSKAFDSIHRRKMEQILLGYDLPQKVITAIMMFYKNTKAMVP